jgi:hypothetical protein
LLCFVNIFLCRREYHSFPVDTGVGRKQHASALAPTDATCPAQCPGICIATRSLSNGTAAPSWSRWSTCVGATGLDSLFSRALTILFRSPGAARVGRNGPPVSMIGASALCA